MAHAHRARRGKRRELVTALLSSWLLVIAQPSQGQQQELRGVWLTANDMPVLRDRERMQATLDQLAALQFNRLYVVVWNGGMAYYPSQLSESRGFQTFTYRGLQGQDVIGELINAGRNRGLVVLPWFEFGLMAPPDSELAKQHRNWLTQKRDGGLTSISAAGEVV
ncbi:MAG: glycoside hydrolase family 10 protein, partial [Cyanobacteria bacterium M_surface_7_m2_037]|nr:glycoside hydrolase family 10 protein [Cyanobacteria bacterium M_surface_7_m2_037]